MTGALTLAGAPTVDRHAAPKPYADTQDALKADASHPHGGGDITSGTVDEAYIDVDVTRDTELTAGLGTKADTVHGHDGTEITSGVVGETFVDALIARDTEVATGLAGKSDTAHLHAAA